MDVAVHSIFFPSFLDTVLVNSSKGRSIFFTFFRMLPPDGLGLLVVRHYFKIPSQALSDHPFEKRVERSPLTRSCEPSVLMATSPSLKILAVEDNPDTQTLLRYMLQSHFTLSFCSNVDDALAQADMETFDLFLLDINLGEQRTGMDLLRLLRDRRTYANTPAIALTAYAMPGDRDRFLNGGFNGYISKPFTRRDLLTAIDRVMVDSSQ